MTTIGNDVPDFTAALSGFVCLSRPTFSISLPSVPSISFFSALFMLLSSFFLQALAFLGITYLMKSLRLSVRLQKYLEPLKRVSLNLTSDGLTKMC
jgi:hypothetical protein